MDQASSNMQGRVCLVTGATSGIGLATATGLARMGAQVVIVSRTQEKGERAARQIEEASGQSGVEVLAADLSSQAAVRELAATVIARYERLHVLVNNAGVFLTKRTETVDGIEATLAVNHLAPLLLTQLLLPLLQESAPARVVNVNSGSHYSTHRLDRKNLQLSHSYNVWRAYSQSKLVMLLCMWKLERTLEDSGVVLNCLNPGFVFTHMGFDNIGPSAQKLAHAILSRLGSSPEKGAQTSLWLASAPEAAAVSGKYFDKLVLKQPSKESLNREWQEWMWEESMRLLGEEG